MKNFNRLMKTIRGLLMLLIGMISFTGFSLPKADLIQNSEPDTFVLENLEPFTVTEVSLDDLGIVAIDVGADLHQEFVIQALNTSSFAFVNSSLLLPLLLQDDYLLMPVRHKEWLSTQIFKANIEKIKRLSNRPRDGLRA